MLDQGFRSDLETLINKHGVDTELNIPDWILARAAADAMLSLSHLVEDWFVESQEVEG